MLKRREIREAVISRLKTSAALSALVGENVFDTKVTPFEARSLPGVNVLTKSEEGTSRSLSIPAYNSSLRLVVEIYCIEAADWTAAADAIAEAATEALLADADFVRLYGAPSAVSAEYAAYDGGAQPIAVEILTFTFGYFTEYPPHITDDLARARIDVDVIAPVADPLPGPDGRVEFTVMAALSEPVPSPAAPSETNEEETGENILNPQNE